MDSITVEQIRRFRLHTHHLDRWYTPADLVEVAGACGLQNTPPGAWEGALQNRIPGYTPRALQGLLEEDKTLLQAWSFRGAPVVFPTEESDAFLAALQAVGEEPWIYTAGIGLALDFLGLGFGELLDLLVQVLPRLNGEVVKSKVELDKALAEWMLPLLPEDKRDAWRAPSMYGSPDKQTVGGAVASFLLRPCAFRGLVLFGKRQGVSPTFTGYQGWVGRPLKAGPDTAQKLVRKYLHCFGPAALTGFAGWLGCSPAQAQRMWQTVAEEMEPVCVEGKQRFILARDKPLLVNPPWPERQLHLLTGHDPYLGLQDREVILADKAKRRQVWQTVSNPGAVLWQGEIVGLWKARKKGKALEVEASLWGSEGPPRGDVKKLAEAYAASRQLVLKKIGFQ